MNSEREIVMKLREAKELDESSFEANGSTYKCAFGKYYKDGEQINREDYFKAKDGGGAPASGKKTSGDWSDWRNNSHGEPYPYKDYQVGNLVGTIHDATKDGDGYVVEFWDNDKADEHEVDGVSGKSFKTEKEAMAAIEKVLSGSSDKKSNGLSFEDVQKLAKDHYMDGGDSFYETWDEKQFNDYVKEFGPMTKEKALDLFKTYKGTEDHPEDGESELMQSTETFLNANPHYDMFDEDDYEEQLDKYFSVIGEIEDTFKGDEAKRKKAYEKLSKKLDGFEKNAPESYADTVAKIRSKISGASKPVKKNPYEDYKPEQFDNDMDEFEYEIEEIADALKDIHPEERDDYDYYSKLDDMDDKLKAMEEYLTDEQFERSDQLRSKISDAQEVAYEGPSIYKYDDPYASRGLRRSDFY